MQTQQQVLFATLVGIPFGQGTAIAPSLSPLGSSDETSQPATSPTPAPQPALAARLQERGDLATAAPRARWTDLAKLWNVGRQSDTRPMRYIETSSWSESTTHPLMRQLPSGCRSM